MVQRPTHPDYDEDIDDIMASIMRGEPTPEDLPKKPLRQPLRPRRNHGVPSRPIPTPTPVSAPTPVQQQTKQQEKRRKLSKKARIGIVVTPVALTLVIGGIYFLKEPVLSLLRPRPPFSQEIVENMGVPLHYPVKLPGTFKIELDSIKQPESGVTVYAVSDDDGRRININQQQQPSDINLDPLYAVLDNVREVDTKFGPVRIGVNEGTTNIANILTGKTWIILNYPVDAIRDELLTQIINNLET